MANLTVNQPRIDLLKVEIYQNVNINRNENLPASAYDMTEASMQGAKHKVYVKKEGDDRHFLDFMDSEIKPYVVAVTTLIESPMKLFV